MALWYESYSIHFSRDVQLYTAVVLCAIRLSPERADGRLYIDSVFAHPWISKSLQTKDLLPLAPTKIER